MISAPTYRFFRLLLGFVIFAALTLATSAVVSTSQAQARKPAQVTAQIAQPLWQEYRGVRLGMTAAQVAQKIGAPKEANDRDQFYAFSDSETAQVFYDTQHVVIAVTANYLGEQSGAPSPEKVFGTPVEVKPDGSIYKMVKYPQAGYFIVYTRGAGDNPLVTVAMQKIEE
jgi:outer membrane protein assembly factor BamE (lipoprotein component of BamABCDE complex)